MIDEGKMQTSETEQRPPRVLVVTRFERELDEDLEGFCTARNMKKGGFIADAVREKLLRERGVIK